MKSIFHLLAVALTAGGQTGGGLRFADLFGSSPIPDEVGIQIKVTTNGTSPGSGKTVTVHYALADQPDLSVAQVSEADAEQVLDLPDAVTTTRVYTLPVIKVSQRYLYLWFDNDDLTADAALVVEPTINGSNCC